MTLPPSLKAGPAAETGIKDSFSAATLDKGHGRIEKRTLTASAGLNDYLDWPYVQQVFKLERRVEYVKEGRITHERVYGITSLALDQADPQRLLEIVRTHWNIENGLHYRRDETLREDWCHLRLGHAQRMMAAVNQPGPGAVVAAWSQKRAPATPPVCCPMGRGP